MRPGWGSRQERVSARDAALRRIGWWTAALAAGSVVGTAAVAGAAQVAARPASVDVPVTVADSGDLTDASDVADSGDPGNPDSSGDPDGAPSTSPTVPVAAAHRSTARGASGQTGTRAPRRTDRPAARRSTAPTAAPRRQAPKPPPVTTAGS